jgi:hypothetical protein
MRDIKALYHFLTLSHYNLIIVSVSTVYVPFIIKYVCHTVITEFEYCILVRYEHIIV